MQLKSIKLLQPQTGNTPRSITYTKAESWFLMFRKPEWMGEGEGAGQARTGIPAWEPSPSHQPLSCSLIIVLPPGFSGSKSITGSTVQDKVPEKPKLPKLQPTFPEEMA